MDYKYIEQLLERYWNCETSLEEEQILRSFFSQKDVPDTFAAYAPLFVYQSQAQEEGVSDTFGARMEARIAAEMPQKQHTKARHIPLSSRFAPFFKAAAIVAVILTVGGAAERASIGNRQPEAATTSPVLQNSYIRSDKVALTIAPAEKRNEVKATALANDSISSLQNKGEVDTTRE